MRRRILVPCLALAAAVLAPCLSVPAPSALAVEPSEVLSDPALEARARALSQGLRCLVCQNQTIDDSNAGLARDLRIIVRERLVAGDSDEAVLAYITARYGDFVLLSPPMKPKTYALWFGPLLILVLGAFGMARYLARRRLAAGEAEVKPLSTEEKKRLQSILEEGEDR